MQIYWNILLACFASGAVIGLVFYKPLRAWAKRFWIAPLIVFSLIALPTVTRAQDEGVGVPGRGDGRIEGVVINADTDAPPEEQDAIKIMVNGWLPVYSGKDGEWNITALGAGNYTIELVDLPEGYNPAQLPQTIYNNGNEAVVLDLKYHTGPAPEEETEIPEGEENGRVSALGADADAIDGESTAATETDGAESTVEAQATDGVEQVADTTDAKSIVQDGAETDETQAGADGTEYLPAETGGGAMFAQAEAPDNSIVPWMIALLVVGLGFLGFVYFYFPRKSTKEG